MHRTLLLALLVAQELTPQCGGSSSTTTPVAGPATNVQAITVNAGPANNYFNGAFTSVTICAPGQSTVCQTIDGVLVDTERDGHRVAFNRAFEALGIQAEWDVPLYGELLVIGGGKERMRHYFDTYGWPAGRSESNDELIALLHKTKTDFFTDIIASGQLPLRPGIARIVDEAI